MSPDIVSPISPVAQLLQLHTNYPDLRRPHVLERMGGQWRRPDNRWWRVAGNSRIHDELAVLVAPQKVTPTDDIQYAGPAVGMHWDALSRWDPGLEHSYILGLQQ